MDSIVAASRAGRPRDPRLDAAIVHATVELLEERGYHDLAIQSVAERAGTSKTAIYRRWGTKSKLVADAVLALEGDEVVADTDDVRADIATMVRWTAKKLSRPAAVAALVGLLGEARDERAARAPDMARAFQQTVDRLERARAAGEIRDDCDVRTLGALISGPVLALVLTGQVTRLEAGWVEDLVRVVLDGVTAAPGGPTRRTAVKQIRGRSR